MTSQLMMWSCTDDVTINDVEQYLMTLYLMMWSYTDEVTINDDGPQLMMWSCT